MYVLTYGSIEETILKQAMRGGQPIPEFIKNKPELEPGLEVYLNAYLDLDSERTHAFGPAGIPVTSMLHYAKAFNFDEDQQDDLVYFLRAMDSENLKRVKKLQKGNGDK